MTSHFLYLYLFQRLEYRRHSLRVPVRVVRNALHNLAPNRINRTPQDGIKRDFLILRLGPGLAGRGTEAGDDEALEDVGGILYGGVAGDADTAVNAFLHGTLGYDPDVHCHHHDASEAHACGGCHGEGHDCGGCHAGS